MTHLPRADELEQFKTQIDLAAYIESRGYTRDPRASSNRYAVLRSPSGDKINVSRGSNGHFRYVNTADDRDKGTIVDFVQLRDRCSLGEVRKTLRAWLNNTPSNVTQTGSSPPPSPSPSVDLQRVRETWRQASLVTDTHAHLQQERSIPQAILADPIFAGRIRTEGRFGNAMFAHFGPKLCGFEIKNRGFTGFATGGVKGLHCSRAREDDRELVISETAIDSLSYAALFGTERRRFVSTAGQPSSDQLRLVQSAAQKLPAGAAFVLALDNDDGGRRLELALRATLAEANVPASAVRTHLPDALGADWNDVLKASRQCVAQAPAPARG